MSPLQALLAAVIPIASFFAGVIVGRAIERRPAMSPTLAVASAARTFYERWSPALYVLIFVVAAGGVFIGSVSALATGRVVDCLERHAKAKAVGDQAVRDASELLTKRQKRAARTLQNVLQARSGSKQQRDLFVTFTVANGRAVKAYRNLEKVRAANPVIPDPATYCKL